MIHLTDLDLSRFVRNFRQLIQFGIVGGSGVFVNVAVVIVVRKLLQWGWGISEYDSFFNIFGTPFNVRWYHVFMACAFLIANTWNYQLNRMWTFNDRTLRSWWRGFFPFLLTGFTAFIVSTAVATLLMNAQSPISLPDHIFDDSTGFRTKVYWANAIGTMIAMPVNFIINKLWTFRKPQNQVAMDKTIEESPQVI
ncbi:GtrA family protein [Corynebacterium sp. sy039]|nr:GtrA family protein [Corynebacterium sp. sy039]